MTRKRLTRQESRAQTRERLLEAAARIFSQRGFDAASVDEIAEEAGFSKGAVYSNFASKEELFMTLLDQHLAAEFQSIASRFTEQGQQDENARTQINQSFPAHLEEQRTWNLLSIEFFLYALRHPKIQQQLAERYRMARAELTRLLQKTFEDQHQQQHALPAEYISWVLLGLGTGLSLQAYVEPGAMPADLYSKVVGQLLADGE